MLGYVLRRAPDVAAATWRRPGSNIVQEVDAPHVRFQYDRYHMQRMEGQLIEGLTRHHPWIGHVQIADVPDRHEPGTGEIHYANVIAALEGAGYDGYVGLEYRPSGSTEASLAWLPRHTPGVGSSAARPPGRCGPTRAFGRGPAALPRRSHPVRGRG